MFSVGAPFVLGVNYWPRRSAMRMWKQFDLKEIKSDFIQMRDLGLKLVRIFLLWEDFQPSPTEVRNVDKLLLVNQEANAQGLMLDITFFTGLF
jgi:endo-1,4-beta-mannosidase